MTDQRGRRVLEDSPGHILARMHMWEVEDDRSGPALEIDLEPDLCNPHGSLHASVLAGLIDCGASGAAVRAVDSPNLAGADLNVRFVAPVRVGPARVVSEVLRAGRRAVLVRADVVDMGADRALVATATMSFTRLG